MQLENFTKYSLKADNFFRLQVNGQWAPSKNSGLNSVQNINNVLKFRQLKFNSIKQIRPCLFSVTGLSGAQLNSICILSQTKITLNLWRRCPTVSLVSPHQPGQLASRCPSLTRVSRATLCQPPRVFQPFSLAPGLVLPPLCVIMMPTSVSLALLQISCLPT